MSKTNAVNRQEEKAKRDSGVRPSESHGGCAIDENPAAIAEIIRAVLQLAAPLGEAADQMRGILPYGACRFCGRVTDTLALGFIMPDAVEEYVSRYCRCPGAETYRAKVKHEVERERDLDRAMEQIDAMFGQGAGGYDMLPVLAETREYLYSGAVAIYDGKIRDITINIGEGVQVKVAKNAKDNLKISKKDTSTFSQEV